MGSALQGAEVDEEHYALKSRLITSSVNSIMIMLFYFL